MILRLLLLLWISLTSITTYGFDLQDEKNYFNEHFDFHGYLGYQFIFGTEKPEPIKSAPEVGLIINYTIDENWTAFTQFRLDQDELEQSVAYAFIEYNNTVFNLFPIRIIGGKIRHQYGLYNKDRLNPSTRPGTVAPQAMYWNSLRFAITSGYGFSFRTNWDNLFITYTIDAPVIVDAEEEAGIWTSGLSPIIKSEFGGHQQINIDYIEDTWRFAGAVLSQDWGVGRPGKNILSTIGVEKRIDNWIFSLEGLGIFKPQSKSFAYSATIQYEVNDMLSIHTNFNHYMSGSGGPKLPFKIPDHNAFARDFSVGFSLHKDNWELKSDIHAVQGSVWVTATPEKLFNKGFDNTWYYGGVSVVYHF